MNILNGLWQNFCVSSTFEPGSVQKPLTVACGLDTGTITDDMEFLCDGGEQFDRWVKCVNNNGHGMETVRSTLMDSCNDAIMQMTYKIGKDNFLTYQSIFGFGQKTGIDLPGEANTSTLVYTEDNMTAVDLATNAFGQNYNCTMVQMISAFCSLINGGTYYQPHVVTKITDASGNTISTIEPKAVKQTVSQSTSDQIRDYLYSVVSEGTGGTAKVDGYSMGGKTGTAEKLPRSNGKYLVSFMGFAPYENPQIAIYCIVDEPNVPEQSHSYFAQNITREILEEVLPYMNIYPDEEKTGRNEGLDVTGVNAQYTGENDGTKSRDTKEEDNN
jgi:stage V sporulation protein D (sporulation-specific penicillin-binding protein)